MGNLEKTRGRCIKCENLENSSNTTANDLFISISMLSKSIRSTIATFFAEARAMPAEAVLQKMLLRKLPGAILYFR